MPRGLHQKSIRNAESLEAKHKILTAKYRHDLKESGRTPSEADKASLGRLVALQLLLESMEMARIAGGTVDEQSYQTYLNQFWKLMWRLFPTNGKSKPKKPEASPVSADPWAVIDV